MTHIIKNIKNNSDTKHYLEGSIMNTINGIDISHWQGDIDFTKVKNAGIEFAFIKATDGATGQDAKYRINKQGANEAGIITGTYHYFRALSSTPEAQRDNIITVLTNAQFDASSEYFAVDVELGGNEKATPDEFADNLHQLLTLLACEPILDGKKPFIYCSNNFWNNYIAGDKYNFGDYPLWIANWEVETPSIPETWRKLGKSWTAWQYSSKGSVDGITGDVDLDHIKLA